MVAKTLLFYARSKQSILFPSIAYLLKEKNYDSVFITQNDDEYKVVKQKIPSANVYCLTEFIKNHWGDDNRLSKVDLNQIEKECGVDSIWKVFYADRFLPNYKTEDAIKMIKLHFLFYIEILERHKPSYFVNEEVAIFSSFLFMKLGRNRGCQYIAFSVPRNFTNEKVLLSFDEGTHYPMMEKYYQQNDLTEEELVNARNILAEIVKHKTKPGYMMVTGRKPRFVRNFLRPLMGHLHHILLHPKRDKYNYEQFFSRASDNITYFRYLQQKKYYQQPVEGEKFILFPLHFQPEASTLVKSTDFVNQIHTVETLSKNIPGEYILYVKEHYAQLGHRRMDFYKDIQKYPNVRLIDPWIDSHDLIKKASAVVVLTSTVGWEALMYHKPLFILGNVFYDTFKYSIKVNNIYKLSSLLKEKIAEFEGYTDYQSDYERYFASYLKAMYDGNYLLGQQAVLEDNNIKDLSIALSETISFYENNLS